MSILVLVVTKLLVLMLLLLDVVIQNKGAFPYMGIRILPINLSFFGSIPKKIIYGCPVKMIIYQTCYFLDGWVHN